MVPQLNMILQLYIFIIFNFGSSYNGLGIVMMQFRPKVVLLETK